jgi:hypothetical protein
MNFFGPDGSTNSENYSTRSISDWDRWAPWYDLWLACNDYHRPIKDLLAGFVRPGWRVLDVGGGSGVLSMFLHLGCRPILLEPSAAMRALFHRTASGTRAAGLDVAACRWEDAAPGVLAGHDLVLASNVFHITSIGFGPSLARAFAARPTHVCVAAEEPHARAFPGCAPAGYRLAEASQATIASSDVYRSRGQALAHAEWRKGAALEPAERAAVLEGLVYEARHFWRPGAVRVHLRLWSRLAGERGSGEC